MSKVNFSAETAGRLSGSETAGKADYPSFYRNNIKFSQPEISAAVNNLNRIISGDDKNKKTATHPPYELSIILPPGKKAVSHSALEIAVIKSVFKQNGMTISNGAAEAIAEKGHLDFTPKWDADKEKYVYNDKDGLFYKNSALGENRDMVLAAKQKNADGKEFFGYKFPISSDLQASILAEKDLALEVTRTGKKAFLEKSFNERFGMTLDKALAELPSEIRGQIKQLDARTILSAIFVGGAAVGALKKMPAGTATLIGYAVTLAEINRFGATADHIADQIIGSGKPSDLPVAELKELIVSGGLDVLLLGVGYAGVKIAPKLAGKAVKLSDDVVRIFDEMTIKAQGKVKQAAEKLDDLITPDMVTPEGIRIKSPIEKISEPKKIVSVDSSGKPSGTRFRDDYQSHIKERDFSKLSQRDGVSGAHNQKEFEKYDISINSTLTKNSIKILSKTPHPTVKGIYKIEYKMPVLDNTGAPIPNQWRSRTFPKTIYDSSIISDKQMTQWGREAFADAVQNGFNGTSGNKWKGIALNGLKFEGFIDIQGTNAVRTFYPDF